MMMTTNEKAVYDLIGDEPVAAVDLPAFYHNSLQSFSRTLASLYKQGLLDRTWDGSSGGFGRYLYFRKSV
jgi:hypothetical protein